MELYPFMRHFKTYFAIKTLSDTKEKLKVAENKVEGNTHFELKEKLTHRRQSI
jgi:hypothetical protein